VLCRVFNKTNNHDDGFLDLYHVSPWGADRSLLLNADLQRIINQQTGSWGVKVAAVEVENVDLPQEMQRAIAHQVETEHEAHSPEGEFEASQRLADAADVIGRNPSALQLRYLQTLVKSRRKNSTTIFPFPSPIDTIAPFLKWLTQK